MSRSRSVLIIGGSGFIGSQLATRLREGYKVTATYNTKPLAMPGVTFVPLNVSNKNWVKRIVYMANPDVVIYAAGDNSLDKAEINPRGTEQTHTSGPATVSNVSDILQPKFIFLSNCYTFDGHRGNYHENDIVLPSTILGKAKVGGENFIRGKSLNYLIVRSSPVFGRGNGTHISFLDHLRMRLDRGERVEMPSNELHSFTPVSALVDFVCRLADAGPKNKTLHFGGLTKVTYYEFARTFARRFGYDEQLIHEKRRKSSSGANAEPFDFSLNSTQMVESLKVEPLLLEQGLDLIEKQLIPSA